MTVGSSFATASLRERFDCPACAWRGHIVVQTGVMIVETAPSADPARLERLRREEQHGTLSNTEHFQLRALEDAEHLQASFGSVGAGLDRRARAAAPDAAAAKARWLADTARCPGCNRRPPQRVRAQLGPELRRALKALSFALGLAFVVGFWFNVEASAASTSHFAAGVGLALPAWAVYVAVSLYTRWNAPTDDVTFVPDAR
jgi:hypothetical protein